MMLLSAVLFAPSPQFKPTDFEGIMLPAALKYSIGVSGGRASGYVMALGSCGTFDGTRGLSKSAEAVFLDVDLAEVGKAIGADLEGKVGRIEVHVSGDDAKIVATKFSTKGDWIQRAEADINLKTRKYEARVFAMGGVIKASGELPDWRTKADK